MGKACPCPWKPGDEMAKWQNGKIGKWQNGKMVKWRMSLLLKNGL